MSQRYTHKDYLKSMSFKTKLYRERYSKLLSSAYLTPFPLCLWEESPLPFFFFKLIWKPNLFLAVLSLHCHEQASFSCSEQELFDSCRERDSLCGGFSRCVGSSGRDWWALGPRLSSRGARAWLLCGMWDLLGPGIEPVSLVLESGCLTTGPPGRSKSPKLVLVFTPFTQII